MSETARVIIPRQQLLDICDTIKNIGSVSESARRAAGAGEDVTSHAAMVGFMLERLEEEISAWLPRVPEGIEVRAALLEVRFRRDQIAAGEGDSLIHVIAALEEAGRRLKAAVDAVPLSPLVEALYFPPSDMRSAAMIAASHQANEAASDNETPRALVYRLKLDGEYWDVQFGEEKGKFKDTHRSGFRYIAKLLRNPNKPLSGTDLKPIPDDVTSSVVDLGQAGESLCGWNRGPLTENIDTEGLYRFKKRIDKINELMEIAEKNNSLARVDELQDEKDRILKEIREYAGKGRLRRALKATPEYKAFRAVSVAIGRAKEKMNKPDLESGRAPMPGLARHLELAILEMNPQFTYVPAHDKEHDKIVWDVE